MCDYYQWNPFISSPCQGWSVLGPVLFLIFIHDLFDSLENPLYLFADNSTLCHDISHPSERQAAASSLSSDLDKKSQTGQTLGTCLSILRNLTHSFYLSKRTVPQTFPSTFSTTLSKRFIHPNSWVSLSAKTSLLSKLHFKIGLQCQMPTEHPPSCKVLPWHT